MLNTARQKIKDVESKVTAQETRIQGFHSQMRKFESQIKARERAHAMRLNDVSEATKLLKESKQSLEKQKDALEQRVDDLKRLMSQKERKHDDAVSKLNLQLTEFNLMLTAEQEEKLKLEAELETAINQKIAMETLKNEIEIEKNEIEKKLQQMDSALSTAKISAERTKGSKRTEHEEELWVQLQGTQVLLQSTQQTLAAVQEEKNKIEASLKQIKEKSDISKMEEAITEKENTIAQLNENIKSLTAESEQMSKTISEQKKKLHDLERQLAIKYYERNKTHGTDMKQKTAELESEFIRLQEQNSEMEKHIRELHAELQRKENEQLKALKDRDELIRVLKNKEKKQAEQIMDLWSLVQEHESAASTVCQDMSGKDAEIKDLQKILEIKQLQILRLEKLVRKQEEQLDRWGLQRTRQEARIAELEHNLREKQRYSDQPFQNDDSSFPKQEKSSNGVEKHTYRDRVSPWKKQQDYRYLDGKKMGTGMMAREKFQRYTPEDKTITSSYNESDWSHSRVTPHSDHKRSFNVSGRTHRQMTQHSGHNQKPKNSKDMVNDHMLESSYNENVNHISFTSPKTSRNMQHPYKSTNKQWRPTYKGSNHFDYEESIPTCHRPENVVSNYPSEYNDVLVPEQCTMIYENGKEAWQFDATSDEGQIYHVYDNDSSSKPYVPSLEHTKGISKSYRFYSDRNNINTNKKQVSKSDPTALNKAVPPYYSCQGQLGAIGDNIMIKNNESFPRYNVGFCKVCNGRLASEVINVHQNYSEPYRKTTPTCHPKPSPIGTNEMVRNLSTHAYPHPAHEEYKKFPVAEVYESGEMSSYFPHFGDQNVNIVNMKRKKYLNSGIPMPEIMEHGRRKGLNDLLNSPVILCASPSAVLLLNCPYITNYLLHSPQLLKNKSIKYGTSLLLDSIDN